MFTSSLFSENIPLVQTRQALLIIDLQNDFLSMHSRLPVDTGSGFVDNIKTLAPVFRQTGDVIWVRTEYEEERSINDGQGLADTVITDEDVPKPDGVNETKTEDDKDQAIDSGCQRRPGRPSKRAMELLRRISARNLTTSDDPDSEEDDDNETFLSRSKGGKAPICCKPDTLGSRFVDDILPAMDPEKDTMVVKSHYSAFKSDSLLFTLRGKLVTELYICGSLSNISVYATALDAARHGFSITILEDCVGYRDHTRHQEAMRQMADMMGADGLTSNEFIESYEKEQLKKLKREARFQERPNGHAIHKTRMRKRERVRQSPPDLSSQAGTTEPFPTLDGGISPNNGDVAAAAWTEELHNRDKINAGSERPQKELPNPDNETVSSVLSTIEVDTASDEESQLLETTLKHTRTRRRATSKDSDPLRLSEYTRGNRSYPRKRKPVNMKGVLVLPSRPVSGTDFDEETSRLQPPRGQTPTLHVLDAVAASLETAAVSDVSSQSRPVSNETEPAETANDNTTVERSFVRKEKRFKRARIGAVAPLLNPSDSIGEGDSRIVEDLLSSPLVDNVFERVKNEVQWHTMSHKGGEVPRLVAVEGEVDADGSVPIYRHPADESPPLLPFSSTVSAIRDEVQKVLKHPVNHVLIQLYRDGKDNISEHSDKTLDIVRGSNIVNVSLGAQRTMTLRTKKSAHARRSSPSSQQEQRPAPIRNPSSEGKSATRPRPSPPLSKTDRQSQRIALPHNSMFILGQQTNMRWLHAIRADKRIMTEKSDQEMAYSGERISLTFRHIGTFLNESEQKIWGQGARNKEKANAAKIVKSRSEAENCLQAFGMENHSTEFDWDQEYGAGFDVVHMNPTLPKVILNGDNIAGSQVKLCLAELGISYDEEGQSNELSTASDHHINDTTINNDQHSTSQDKQNPSPATEIEYVDNDAANSTIEGALPILLYLDKFNTFSSSTTTLPQPTPAVTRAEYARILTRTFRAPSLIDIYSRNTQDPHTDTQNTLNESALNVELAQWNTWASEGTYIAGETFSIADCAFWPVLNKLVADSKIGNGDGEGTKQYEALWKYFRHIKEKHVKKIK